MSFRSWIGGAIAVAMMCPSVAMGAAKGEVSASVATDVVDEERAKELFAQGEAAYDTFQYERAAELFTNAYALLPADQPGARNAMVYNIARAQERAFEMDGDVAHLRQAALLLASWTDDFERMYLTDSPEVQAELVRAQTWLERLESRIETIEHGDTPPPPEDWDEGRPVPNVSFDPTFVTPEMKHHRERLAAENRVERTLAAGWSVGGVGVLTGVIGVGMLGGSDSGPGRVGGAVVLSIGGAMLVSGSVLLGVGYKRRKRLRERSYAVTPAADPNSAGLVVTGRF